MRTILLLTAIWFGVCASARSEAPSAESLKTGVYQGLKGSKTGSTSTATPLISPGTSAFAESPPILPEMIDRHSDAVRKMLVAITNADFPGFLFEGDKRFQTFEREKFNGLARTWAQPLSAGFGMTFLGELKRGAAATTLWRIRPNGKSKDVLVILESNSRGSVSDIALF